MTTDKYGNELKRMKMNDDDLYSNFGYHDPYGFPEEYNYRFYETFCNALQSHFVDLKTNKEIDLKDDITFETHQSPIKRTDMGIFYKKGNINLQLKSDQFGFSAVYGDKEHVYPYRAYYESKNVDKVEAKNKIFSENGWINKTRQPGGSFLWPIEDTKFNPEYNKKRGGHCYSDKKYYIQDRVDLTLYEIQEVYDFINNKKTKEEIRENILIKCSNEGTNMFKFLKTFETFETFIKVFGFDGNFVRKVKNEWKIVNIFPYKCDDEDKTDRDDEYVYLNDKYVKKARCGDKLFTINTKAEDFENMFNVVCKLIEKRRKKLSSE